MNEDSLGPPSRLLVEGDQVCRHVGCRGTPRPGTIGRSRPSTRRSPASGCQAHLGRRTGQTSRIPRAAPHVGRSRRLAQRSGSLRTDSPRQRIARHPTAAQMTGCRGCGESGTASSRSKRGSSRQPGRAGMDLHHAAGRVRHDQDSADSKSGSTGTGGRKRETATTAPGSAGQERARFPVDRVSPRRPRDPLARDPDRHGPPPLSSSTGALLSRTVESRRPNVQGSPSSLQ